MAQPRAGFGNGVCRALGRWGRLWYNAHDIHAAVQKYSFDRVRRHQGVGPVAGAVRPAVVEMFGFGKTAGVFKGLFATISFYFIRIVYNTPNKIFFNT